MQNPVHEGRITAINRILFFFNLLLLISTSALPSRNTTGYLQRCLQFIPFTSYPLSTGQCLVGTLGVLTNLISLGIFLKCMEDMSEEVCDADGIYVVL